MYLLFIQIRNCYSVINKKFSIFKFFFLILALCSVSEISGQNKTELNDSLVITPPHTTDSSVDTTDSLSSPLMKDTVLYEADIIEYDVDDKIILMRGKGIVRYKTMALYADTIHFLFSENMLVATGHPQLVDGADTVAGENMVYNLKTRRGKVHYGTAHSDNSKYNGVQLARSDDKSYYIKDGDYSSCAVIDSPHYCFYGRKIKVTPKDKVISKPVVLNVGGAPVAALPYFIIPLQTGRRSGWLTPRWGGNPTSGGHLDNIGYYWAPNEYTDFKIASKISEFETFVIDVSTNYALRYWLNGSLSSRYSVSSNFDTLNNIWSLDYNHYQNLVPDESMTLSGRGNIVSGKSFYKSVSEDTTELLRQQIDANLSLTKKFKKINAYGSITWQRSHNFKTNIIDQDLPSFSFTLNQRPLIPYNNSEESGVLSEDEDNEKWYHKINYNYNAQGIHKYKRVATQKSRSNHSGFKHSVPLNASMKLFKWFNATPRFSINHSFFDSYADSASKYFDTTYNHLYVKMHTQTPDTIIKDVLIDTFAINDTIKYLYLKTDTVSSTKYDTVYFWQDDYDFTEAQTFSWNTGVDFSTQLYGIFPIKVFNLTGVRHTLTPHIGYTYQPQIEVNTDKIFPSIGINVFQSPLAKHTIDFSIKNLFQGRASTKKKKQTEHVSEKKFTMLDASISTNYTYVKNDEQWKGKWADISLNANTSFKFLRFSYNSRFRPYTSTQEIDYLPALMYYSLGIQPSLPLAAQGSLWGGDLLIFDQLQPKNYLPGYGDFTMPGWSVSLSPSYNFTKSRNTPDEDFVTSKDYMLSTNAQIKFTHKWSAAWSSRYDFTRNQFTNHAMNITCDLECWELKFDWYPSGINKGSFYFIVKIKKHPEIKWDLRPQDL